MLLSSYAYTHDGSPTMVTCPICATKFYVVEFGNYLDCGRSGEGGPKSYSDFQGQIVHCCPACHYSGNSNRFWPETNWRTEQVEAVKTVLAASKYPAPPTRLYPAEYVDLARQCLSVLKPEPAEMLEMHLMCAWMYDDAGKDDLATASRIKAMAACRDSLLNKTLKLADRFWRRRLQWVIMYNLGRRAEALKGMTDLQTEIEQFIETRRKSLPPKPDAYDIHDGEMPYKLRNGVDRDGAEHIERRTTAKKSSDPQAKAKLRKIWNAWLDIDELKSVAFQIKYWKTVWLYKALRPTKALALARKGRWAERSVFIEMFKSSSDFRVIAGIKAFVEKPMGLEPKELSDAETSKWMSDESSGRHKLESTLRTDGTSSELREFAKRHADLSYDNDQSRPSLVDLRIKRASTAFLVKRLTRIQDDFLPYPSMETSLLGAPVKWWSETPADIIAELIRRRNTEACAALSGHFADNTSWYASTIPALSNELFLDKEHEGMFDAYSYSMDSLQESLERTASFFKAIARDPKMATLAAKRLLYRAYTDEEIDGDEGHVAIMPLGYLNSDESRQLLIEAAGIDDYAISYTAAMCLLLQGDLAGKDAMIDAILTYQADDLPEGPAGEAFIGMLKPQDAKVLPKFKELFLGDDEIDAPIRIIAALARAANEQGGVYDALLARMTPTAKPSKNGIWRPAVIDYDWESLIQAAGIYYRPAIGKHFARAINALADDDITPDLIEAMGTARAVDQIPTLAELLKRPSPVRIKTALIKASRALDIPHMPDKLIQWSRSQNEELAQLAKAEITRRGKAVKKQ